MNIQDVLREMREEFADDAPVMRWADAIEQAMREPMAEVRESKGSLTACHNTRGTIPVGTKLFAFPPDAAAKIATLEKEHRHLVARLDEQNGTPCEQVRHKQEAERKDVELLSLAEQLAASREENSRLRKRRNEIDDEAREYAEQVERQGAEIVHLRGDLHVATNAHAGVLRELEDARAEIDRLKADREQGHADYCALQDRYDDQHNEIERLTDTLNGIEIYATDTLSKPVTGPDDRKWYRDGMIEIVKRVRAAISTQEEPKP